MATFIYFGRRFAGANTEGYFATYTCVETQEGAEWEVIQSAMDRGENIEIIQPNAAQLGAMEDLLALYKRVGGPAAILASEKALNS